MKRNASKSNTERPVSTIFSILFLIGLVLCFAVKSEAIPAFARQLNTKCHTCHFPNPPRLNNVGIVFKRMGYRLPDADDNGNLIFKTPEIHNALEFASVVANVEFEADKNPPAPEQNKSTLSLGEVELFGAHALGPRLSYLTMFELRNEEGEAELEVADVQYNLGSATDAFHLRGGRIQTLWWQKTDHEGLTLSMAPTIDEMGPAMIGSFAGFGLGQKQVAAEFGYTHNRLVEGSMTSTILSAMILNGVDVTGEQATRRSGSGYDFFAQGYQLFGSSNTAGGFYYHGNTRFGVEEVGPPMERPGLRAQEGQEGVEIYKDSFDRYGFVGNYLIGGRADVLAGFVAGKDKSTELNMTINNQGWFIETDFSLAMEWSLSYRHDDLDPDTDFSGDNIKVDTVSTRYHVMDYLLLTLEFNSVRTEEKDYSVIAQVKFTY